MATAPKKQYKTKILDADPSTGNIQLFDWQGGRRDYALTTEQAQGNQDIFERLLAAPSNGFTTSQGEVASTSPSGFYDPVGQAFHEGSSEQVAHRLGLSILSPTELTAQSDAATAATAAAAQAEAVASTPAPPPAATTTGAVDPTTGFHTQSPVTSSSPAASALGVAQTPAKRKINRKANILAGSLTDDANVSVATLGSA